MKGCRVTISVYFALLIACVVVLDHTGLAVLALLCVAIHEAGHFVCLGLLRVPVREVDFRAFGIHIRLAGDVRLSYGREAAVALSGCAANLLFGLGGALFYTAGVGRNQAQAFLLMNLLLCGFNLLPVASLDGGRALESLLCLRLRYLTARRIIDVLSAVLILPMTFLGIWLVGVSGYNFSLVLAAVYLAAGLVCKGRLIEIA